LKSNRFAFSLSAKLSCGIIGSLLVIVGWLGYEHLEEMTFGHAHAISDLIKASTRDSMLGAHGEEVHEIIQAIGREPGINKIRVFDEKGRIGYSTDAAEVNTLVDKNAEACYKCHAKESPLVKLNRPDRVRTYSLPSGERILGLINPVDNEPACSNAPCHVHSSDTKVLGVLDVTLSLGQVDAKIADGQRALVLSLAAALLLVSGVIALLIWLLVHRPVKGLYIGTRRVAEGNLDHKIPVTSRDEIGQLAASFNRMTGELKKANDELKDWARTLEDRVDEKTRELRETHERMIHVERMASMGKLAAMVAHEINNPLTGILTAARYVIKRLARESPGTGGDPKVREHLEMVASEASRCGAIVRNLLEFTRRAKGEYSPNDPRTLISESLRLLAHKFDLMSLEVRLVGGDKVPPILCDPQEIKQALVAVLLNACDALGGAGGVLEVETRAIAEDNTVEIGVKDNGQGMDEETRKRIFEPFFTTKEGGRNVGLGLAVVQAIVSRHSGSIDVESAPGVGTTVRLRFPVFTDGEAKSAAESAVPGGGGG
jgi:two-component system NtrC family sensor kinase